MTLGLQDFTSINYFVDIQQNPAFEDFYNDNSNGSLNETTNAEEVARDTRIPYQLIPVLEPVPERPLKLALSKKEILNGKWLTDLEITNYLMLLKDTFKNVKGLESPLFYNDMFCLENRTNDFIRVVNCNNNHWICVVGVSRSLNEDIRIYDSMKRTKIEPQLRDVLFNLVPETTQKIIIRIMRCHRQTKSISGYLSLAFATAVAFDVDPEGLAFKEKDVTKHLLGCFKNKTVNMFPHSIRTIGNLRPTIIPIEKCTE